MGILSQIRSLARSAAREPLRFPTHTYEYSSAAFRGHLLIPKYRAIGRMLRRRKATEYVRAQYDTLDDGA